MQVQPPTYILYNVKNNYLDGRIRTSNADIVHHVLKENNLYSPGLNPNEMLVELPSRILARQEEITTRSRTIEALKEKITQENAISAQERALQTALRIVRTSLLVLAYSVLAATVIGIPV